MHPIAHIRLNLFGVTQKEFAEIAQVNQATVSRWENGSLAPDLNEVDRICRAATARGLALDERWFFRRPEEQSAAS